jgi:UDP-N-acetylglucosamine--N-acetylmuramyl-(pentapeptide) pyrophosphoryl-undecaprenol N-acetylglucosamine transferase
MNTRYAWADVVIARAGAGTIAELAANGRPAILVPFPRSAAGHQGANARWLAERGGAMVVEETRTEAPRHLAEALGGLARDRGRLREMAACSRRAGIRGAAARIVSECYELLGVQRG